MTEATLLKAKVPVHGQMLPVLAYPRDGGWHVVTVPYRATYGAWSRNRSTALARLKAWCATMETRA